MYMNTFYLQNTGSLERGGAEAAEPQAEPAIAQLGRYFLFHPMHPIGWLGLA